jgi:hypothetical protein
MPAPRIVFSSGHITIGRMPILQTHKLSAISSNTKVYSPRTGIAFSSTQGTVSPEKFVLPPSNLDSTIFPAKYPAVIEYDNSTIQLNVQDKGIGKG